MPGLLTQDQCALYLQDRRARRKHKRGEEQPGQSTHRKEGQNLRQQNWAHNVYESLLSPLNQTRRNTHCTHMVTQAAAQSPPLTH